MLWRLLLATLLALTGGGILAETAANYARALQAVHTLRMRVEAVEVRDAQIVFSGRVRNNSDLTLRLDTLTVRFWLDGQPVGNGRLEFGGRPLPPGEEAGFTVAAGIDPDRLDYVRARPEPGRTWELEGRLACYLPFGAERFSVPLRGKWTR